MKALRIKVFKNKLFDGCANGGITERFDELLLVCEDGYIEIDENDPPENLVIYVERNIGGRSCGYIRPFADPPSGRTPYSSGGSYAADCDSRFTDLIGGMYGAVPVHDRTETWEEYELLSR